MANYVCEQTLHADHYKPLQSACMVPKWYIAILRVKSNLNNS